MVVALRISDCVKFQEAMIKNPSRARRVFVYGLKIEMIAQPSIITIPVMFH